MSIPGPLLHIAARDAWAAAAGRGVYAPEGWERDGFVHCSAPHQYLHPANLLYRGRDDVVLLVIDPAALAAPLRWEPGTHGEDDLFPHVYGPLDTAAVRAVVDLPCGDDGGFTEPPGLAAALAEAGSR